MDEINNAGRVAMVALLLRKRAEYCGQDDEASQVTDLLADLMHYCKSEPDPIDFDHCLSMATDHFGFEFVEPVSKKVREIPTPKNDTLRLGILNEEGHIIDRIDLKGYITIEAARELAKGYSEGLREAGNESTVVVIDASDRNVSAPRPSRREKDFSLLAGAMESTPVRQLGEPEPRGETVAELRARIAPLADDSKISAGQRRGIRSMLDFLDKWGPEEEWLQVCARRDEADARREFRKDVQS